MHCNLQCKQTTFVPVIFHNLKNFDAHLLCQGIGETKRQKMSCIPQTMEKYITFSIGNLRFIDSLGFLPSSLASLVDNLNQDGPHRFVHFQSEIVQHRDMLLRKGTPTNTFNSGAIFMKPISRQSTHFIQHSQKKRYRMRSTNMHEMCIQHFNVII